MMGQEQQELRQEERQNNELRNLLERRFLGVEDWLPRIWRYDKICTDMSWRRRCYREILAVKQAVRYPLSSSRSQRIEHIDCQLFFVEQALQKKMNEAALDPVLVAGGTRTLQLWVYVGLEFRTVFDLLYSACRERVQNLFEICMGSRCFPNYGPESDPNWPELIHVRT